MFEVTLIERFIDGSVNMSSECFADDKVDDRLQEIVRQNNGCLDNPANGLIAYSVFPRKMTWDITAKYENILFSNWSNL